MNYKPPKDYLGDGAYAEADDFGGVILTAEDGVRATDRVVLEPEVLAAFERYVARMREAQTLARSRHCHHESPPDPVTGSSAEKA